MTVFGRPVMVRPARGLDYTARGVFDNKHVEVFADDGTVHYTTRPQLGIRLSEWAQLPGKGDEIFLDQDRYGFTGIEPDGQGGAIILMHRISDLDE